MSRSVEKILRGAGITDEPEQYDSNIHSWRCRYPEIYGRCDCFQELVQELEIKITDDMVEKAGRVMYSHWDEWDSDDVQAIGERQLMRAALSAALGGGDHVE